MDTITLTIDGTSVTTTPGTTVLNACREAGIHVPTLCNDPRLKPYGSCRLCIVQIEGMRGFPASCATIATDGMVITTDSDVIRDLRRTVVELIVSDHPLDCMTCERAGACELQNAAYELDVSESPFGSGHERKPVDDDHPLIERDPGKCILCGRCVRICDEVQGLHVWDWQGRGFDAIATTAFGDPLAATDCESCGQCVSTCPVGALTARQARGRGRTWELQRTDTTCGYCGVGCTVTLETKGNQVVGASAPLEKGVNRGNLCVKGRFGYDFLGHPDRLTTPLIRRDGELQPASWDEALDLVAEKLQATVAEHGADAVGGLASARCTNEENYLFQRLFRAGFGTNNVDHCARL